MQMKKFTKFFFICIFLAWFTNLMDCSRAPQFVTTGLYSIYHGEKEKIVPVEDIFLKQEPDEFMGIKWGTHINDLAGMKLCSIKDQSADITYYEKLEIESSFDLAEDVKASEIIYKFYKNRFAAGIIRLSQSSKWYPIHDYLSNNWGKPVTFDHWLGNAVSIDFINIVDYKKPDDDKDKRRLYYVYSYLPYRNLWNFTLENPKSVNSRTYSDELVDIIFEIYREEISLMIQNKSDQVITFNWEELKYRTPDGKTRFVLPEKERKNISEYHKKSHRPEIDPKSAKRFVDHINTKQEENMFPSKNPLAFDSKIFTIIVPLKIADTWQDLEFNFKMKSIILE